MGAVSNNHAAITTTHVPPTARSNSRVGLRCNSLPSCSSQPALTSLDQILTSLLSGAAHLHAPSVSSSRSSLPQHSASKEHARLTCLPVFTTVYGTACRSDCHSYLRCKYGEQCSGRDLKITPPRASVTKLINTGMGAERGLTMQVSLAPSLSHHIPFFSALLSYFPLPLSRLWPNKAQLHGGSFIHYRHGAWLLFVDS